jgi:membrane-bound lytic murein transglycosylase D
LSRPPSRIRAPLIFLTGALFVAGCAPLPPRSSPPSPAASSPPPSSSAEGPDDSIESFGSPETYARPLLDRSTDGAQWPWGGEAAADDSATLWCRIREGFKLPDRNHPLAREYARRYASQPTHLDRVMEQAEPYLYLVVQAIEERGLPSELALLPVVESAYNPLANSPGRAAGLWQFLPSTGDAYGLKQNRWYDGRRDVLESTRAALDYLQKLSGDFDGDWLLAMAAYNAGEGTVQRAVESNRRRGRPTDFWSLKLPAITESYVPKLLGIARLVENPEKFRVTLRPIPDRPMLKAVRVPGPIDLAQAAQLAELSSDEIRKLNACYKRWATGPEGPHRLLLPVRGAELFKERFLALGPSAPSTDRPDAREAGNARPPGADTGQKTRAPVEARVAVAKTGGPPDGLMTYKVRRGDTVWRIARRFQVAADDLQHWNGVRAAEDLKVGQVLRIYVDPATLAGG